MTQTKARSKLEPYIRAGYACLLIQSSEEDRISTEICRMANAMNYECWAWTCSQGLTCSDGRSLPGEAEKAIPDSAEPVIALKKFIEHSMAEEGGVIEPRGKLIRNKSVVILKDFHMFMKNPMIIRCVKDAIHIGRASNRHIVIIGCSQALPPELEQDIFTVPFELPTREELLEVAQAVAGSAKQELDGNAEAIVDAGCGLTTLGFADAAAYAVVTTGHLDPVVISRLKAETVKRTGLMEVVEQNVLLEDIGGLGALKANLQAKRHLFTRKAREYGLPSPKPQLFVGQPGTAKTMCATATKTVFNLAMLRVKAGRLFGSYVGETERNWRTVFGTAKAIAPCIVHMDEIDGLMVGAESSGKTDGGTTARLVKEVLQDLQENSENMLFIFTANDIDGLPDPFIDRCEVWNVELPNATERRAIWAVHIKKRGRDPKKFDLLGLSEQSEGFSGRQIEQAWITAMTNAFNEGEREPRERDCFDVLEQMVPIAKTMAKQIERRRERLAKCARLASDPEPVKQSMGRKIAATTGV